MDVFMRVPLEFRQPGAQGAPGIAGAFRRHVPVGQFPHVGEGVSGGLMFVFHHPDWIADAAAVGSDGSATAFWAGTTNPGPARWVAFADLPAGSTTFGTATTIFTSSWNVDPDATNVAIDRTGATLAVFKGDPTW